MVRRSTLEKCQKVGKRRNCNAFVRRSECAIFGSPEANCGYPLIDEAGILPRTYVVRMVDSTWKRMVVDCAATPLEPS
jgi:hypothetical protein